MAILSILGLYKYDPTIFDGLRVPTAADITDDAAKVSEPFIPDKQTLIDYICMNLAEVSLVYPSAPIIKNMITVWSNVRFPVWVKYYNTLLYSYNPLWNKDGTILETRDLTIRDDFASKNMKTDHTGDVLQDVSAFDQASDYVPRGRQTLKTADTTNGATENVRKDAGTIERRETGNIGLTTTMQLIREEREVVMANYYDLVLADFKTQFCVALY